MTTQLFSLSSSQLKHVNDLTRLSIQPGNLDLHAYQTYLTTLGHVKTLHVPAGVPVVLIPQTTALQTNSADRTDNKTDFRADQALWTQDNLPEVLYIFDKPANRLDKSSLRDPPEKKYDIYGAKLRDIPILPDHISSKVEGWRVEAWMRLDARLHLQDVIDRMPPVMRPRSKTVVQMRSLRFRDDCGLLGWVALGSTFAGRKRDLLATMAQKHIDPQRNSTRGISWGLVDVSLGEAGGRIPVPEGRRAESTVDMSNAPFTSMQSAITMAVHNLPPNNQVQATAESSGSQADHQYHSDSTIDDMDNEDFVEMATTDADFSAYVATAQPDPNFHAFFPDQNMIQDNVQIPTPAASHTSYTADVQSNFHHDTFLAPHGVIYNNDNLQLPVQIAGFMTGITSVQPDLLHNTTGHIPSIVHNNNFQLTTPAADFAAGTTGMQSNLFDDILGPALDIIHDNNFTLLAPTTNLTTDTAGAQSISYQNTFVPAHNVVHDNNFQLQNLVATFDGYPTNVQPNPAHITISFIPHVVPSNDFQLPNPVSDFAAFSADVPQSLHEDTFPAPHSIIRTHNVQLPVPPASLTELLSLSLSRNRRPAAGTVNLTPTILYHGKPLTLKSPAERHRDREHVATLKQEWHPAGSEGRKEQLAYLLDPTKLEGGFVDNCGFHQPVGFVGCIQADIIYGCEHRLRT